MILSACVALLQATALAAPMPTGSGVSVNLTVSDLLLLGNAVATLTNVAFHLRTRSQRKAEK